MLKTKTYQHREVIVLRGALSDLSHQSIWSNPAGREERLLPGQMRSGFGQRLKSARFRSSDEAGNRADWKRGGGFQIGRCRVELLVHSTFYNFGYDRNNGYRTEV